MNPGRINVRALDDVQVGIWDVIADLIDYIVNPDQFRWFVVFCRLFVIDNQLSAIGFQVPVNNQLFDWFDWFNSFNWFRLSLPI
jgi:hypothetical protein